jgi:hypothetical protein
LDEQRHHIRELRFNAEGPDRYVSWIIVPQEPGLYTVSVAIDGIGTVEDFFLAAPVEFPVAAAGEPRQQQALAGGGKPGGQEQLAAEEHEEERVQRQQAAGAQQQTTDHPLTAMPASEVIGTEVVDAEGNAMAEIVDLVRQQDQGEISAVLSVGGFLGIGDKRVVLPLREFDITPENQIVRVRMTEEDVRAMPEYDQEQYETTLEQVPTTPD